MKRKKMVWAAAAIVLAGALAAHRFRRGAGDGPVLREAAAERGNIELRVLATGVVQPRNRLEIKPPIAGRVESILVREGDPAERGQVLAWMSSSERAALLDAARARGPEELARWEGLYRPAPLAAPLDGTVIARNVEPGQTVTAQDALFVMSDRLIVKAQVDETDIGRVKKGQTAGISLDAYPDETVPGRVDHIAFEAKTVNNVTLYEVDVLPARVPDFMRSGMTANVSFVTAKRTGVLLVPAEAVRRGEDGEESALVSGDGGEPARREIETGLSDGKRTEVLDGLEEGETVLVPAVRLPRSSGGAQASPFAPGGPRRRGRNGGPR
jgi:membrane fusion protein, macrolide-specific efflux system